MTDQPRPLRYRAINRDQVSHASLEQQLPLDHPIRAIWAYACLVDLSHFQRPTRAHQGASGAPIIPAQLLFALWIFALSEGLASARRITELCTRDLPYQWLCGDHAVNYHTLTDFFSDNDTAIQQLFVEHIAQLRYHGLIDLHRLTVDGRKIPADASKESSHRQATLERHYHEAQEHVLQVLAERDDSSRSARQQAARERAALDRQARLEQAVAEVQQRQQQRRDSGRSVPEEARCSETDPDAVKMKMPDGGYRLAYNVQTATAEGNGLIVTVEVSTQGSDNGLLAERIEQVHQEQQVRPEQVLADSGFSSQPDVEQLERAGVAVLMPPKNENKELAAGKDPYAAKRRDSEAIKGWRSRMGTVEAQTLYRRRAPVAEGVHARQANLGWRRMRLRGLKKVRAESFWRALTHNLRLLLSWSVTVVGMVRAG